MKKIIFLFLTGFVVACSQFEPFEDTRREAGSVQPVGQSSNNRPVICYNPLWHSENQLKELADTACARTKRKAVLQKTAPFSCRLVNPTAAIYKCQ